MSNDQPLIYYIGIAIVLFLVNYRPTIKKTTKIESHKDIDKEQHNVKIDYVTENTENVSTMNHDDSCEHRYPQNWSEIKRYIIQRDGNKCTICGRYYELHVHHKIPISRGGTHSEYNLETLCLECHSKQRGPGHHNLVKMNTERSKREHLDKYNFNEVITRKEYKCTFCDEVIHHGTASYVKFNWSINSYKSNNKKIPDSKTRLCILCFWEYPKYRS